MPIPINYLLPLLILLFLTQTSCQQYQQQPHIDPTMRYIQQFQQAMSNMFPTQRFTFDLTPGEEKSIMVWAQADSEAIAIAFYVNNDDDPASVTGEGFTASCQVNGARTHNFDNQKLGACIMNITSRPSFIKVNFRTSTTPVTVYLQYQLKNFQILIIPNQQVNQNIPTQQQSTKHKLSQISQKFQKVKKRTQLQEGALRLLTKSFNKHNMRFEKNLRYAHSRLMIETVLVIGSGLLGLWILKKQLGNGYEMLV